MALVDALVLPLSDGEWLPLLVSVTVPVEQGVGEGLREGEPVVEPLVEPETLGLAESVG